MIDHPDHPDATIQPKGLYGPATLAPRLLNWRLDLGAEARSMASRCSLKLRRAYWRWLARNMFVRDFRGHWLAPSYSQEGEDGLLRRIFSGQETGFYVDIGAHHPKRYSNTYYFYLFGWRGINVDPAKGCMELFRKVRPRDINIEAAVANGTGALTYYEFDEPTLNGFSSEISLARSKNGPYRIINERKITTMTLAEILDRYLPAGQPIDFLNIDAEGFDLDVLRSNNWTKYPPAIVLAEDLSLSNLQQLDSSPVVCFMAQQGYELYGKTVNTLVFRRIDQLLPYEQRAKFE